MGLKRKDLFYLFLFLIYGSLLYSRSVGFGFVNFDDTTILLGRPNLYDSGSFIQSLNQILFKAFPRNGPMIIRDISWAIDSHLFGFRNPFGYHLGNVILFSINLSLIFLFLLQIGWSRFYATALALTYGALPLHAEVVCWVMGRKDLLVTFFMLAGLIFQGIYLETREPGTKRIFYLAVLLSTLLALLSKINALTFFALLALRHGFHSFSVGKKFPGARLDWKPLFGRLIPRYSPHLVLSLLAYFWYSGIVAGSGEMAGGAVDLSFGGHLRNWLLFTPLVLGLYLKIIFVPFGHSILYTWPSIHREPLGNEFILLSVFLALLGVGMTVWAFFQRKDLFFYVLAFLLVMFPYLNIVYTGIWSANRYVHFAAIFVLAIAACLIRTLVEGWGTWGRRLVFGFWVAVLSFNLFQSFQYQQAWKDDRSLWAYETTLRNPSIMSFASLAFSFLQQAERSADPAQKSHLLGIAGMHLRRGFEYFENSGFLETEPHIYKLHKVAGMLAEEEGHRIETILAHYRRAHNLKMDDSFVLRKISEYLYRLGLKSSNEQQRERLALEALEFFEQYLAINLNTLEQTPSNLAVLDSFSERFPFLKKRVHRIQKTILKNQSF